MNYDDLPEVQLPADLPAWLIDGFSGTDDSAYAQIEMAAGHDRKRRMYRRPPIRRNVSMIVTAAQMASFEHAFEYDLLAGERMFSAKIRDMGPGVAWYSVQFASPYEADYQHWADTPGNDYWRVSAELIMYGVGSELGPVLTPFKSSAEVRLIARGKGEATQSLSADIPVALLANTAQVGLTAKVEVALFGTVRPYGIIGMSAHTPVALEAVANPVRTSLFSAAVSIALL